jgi:hypothetical protein
LNCRHQLDADNIIRLSPPKRRLVYAGPSRKGIEISQTLFERVELLAQVRALLDRPVILGAELLDLVILELPDNFWRQTVGIGEGRLAAVSFSWR